MPVSRRTVIAWIAALPVGVVVGCAVGAEAKQEAATKPAAGKDAGAKWQSLFDGKDLGHWKPTQFGGEGEAKVENGQLLLTHGETLTGVTWQGAVPAKINYEIELDAQRVDGDDFFCGLTFPYNDTSASLILGGWGGGVCGISCIDDNDAARNDTTSVHAFKTGQWYHVRLRVTADNISAWVDKEQIVDADVKGKKITVRGEVEASQPLGIATYQTTGAIKNIRLRKLDGKP
jgi:hypothetical protein